MGSALYVVIAAIIRITLNVVYFAFLTRMLLPLFFDAAENKIYLFVCLITEPFVIPVRVVLQKFNVLQGSPIDWAFPITCILIGIVCDFLP